MFGALWKRYLKSAPAVTGLVVLSLIFAIAVLAPVLFPSGPNGAVTSPFIPPFSDWSHPLGTDQLGRDFMIRLAYGAQVSLLIGFESAAIAFVIGVPLGAVSGYHGGAVDEVAMRIAEMFQTIPAFVLVLTLVLVLSPSVQSIALSIGLVSWPALARVARAEFLSLRDREFVRACRTMGMGDARIILTQILPNALSSITVLLSVIVAAAVLTESSISFLGLSDQNVVSWGSLIGEGRAELRTQAFLSLLPGCAILVLVVAISLVGEGLNNALNARGQGN